MFSNSKSAVGVCTCFRACLFCWSAFLPLCVLLCVLSCVLAFCVRAFVFLPIDSCFRPIRASDRFVLPIDSCFRSIRAFVLCAACASCCSAFLRSCVLSCVLAFCARVFEFEIGRWFVQALTTQQHQRQLPPPIPPTRTAPDKFRMNPQARTRAVSVFFPIPTKS